MTEKKPANPAPTEADKKLHTALDKSLDLLKKCGAKHIFILASPPAGEGLTVAGGIGNTVHFMKSAIHELEGRLAGRIKELLESGGAFAIDIKATDTPEQIKAKVDKAFQGHKEILKQAAGHAAPGNSTIH